MGIWERLALSQFIFVIVLSLRGQRRRLSRPSLKFNFMV